MPSTTEQPNREKSRAKRAKKVEEKKIDNTNWNTTNEDEIERRKVRAAVEKIHVEQLGRDHNYYTSFVVFSDQWASHDTAKYLVEIRSLNEKINSCNCIDFQTNGLGTCKHIEKVLFFLKKSGKQKFKQTAKENSPWIEIFLDTINHKNKITIKWLFGNTKNSAKNASNYQTVDSLFAADNTLIGEPIAAFSSLKSAIQNASIKSKIRISSHIEDWLRKIKRDQQKNITRDMFKADVNSGKRQLDILKHPLYPYQQEGMLHLVFNERALLADEMGLGKTVQAIAACELLRQTKNIQRVLVVATASLKTEWEEQITKFSDLSLLIIQGVRKDRLKLYQTSAFFYLTNYEQILHDGADIQRLIAPDVIILDEAQRIKNWQTKTAKAIKRLASPYAFVLTGTPLENRIDDIYSIMQFLDPHLLGPLFQFNREFYRLDDRGRPAGYQNLDELHRRLRHILLRRQKSDVEEQLPERTVNHYFVAMDAEQRERYEEYSGLAARILSVAKKRHLRKEEFEKLQKFLACMRMLCDTPYILDPECRISPKLRELENILEELLENKNVASAENAENAKKTKIIIFSEWERMLQLVKELAQEMKLDYAWHTGSVPQKKRRIEINRFKNDPNCRLFLSTDSGSLGLNLQAANVVINLDLPWNPAKLEQRIARAWRKHQKRTVQVITLVAEDSIEHRMIGLLEQKQALAKNVLYEGKIKEMDIPSGQVVFLERLESLMNLSTTDLVKPEEVEKAEKTGEAEDIEKGIPVKSSVTEAQALEQLEQLKNIIFSQNPNNLVLMKKHKHQRGKDVLFIVVADDNDQIRDQIKQALMQAGNLDQSHDIEVLDQKTYESLQHLAELGIININQSTANLFESPPEAETKRKQQDTRIKKSRELLKQAVRKYHLAELLINGDFCQEAIIPLKEAVEKTLIAYAYAHNCRNNTEAVLVPEVEKIKNQILQTPNVPNELFADCWQICSAANQATDAEAKTWLSTSQALLNFVEESLTKLALS